MRSSVRSVISRTAVVAAMLGAMTIGMTAGSRAQSVGLTKPAAGEDVIRVIDLPDVDALRLADGRYIDLGYRFVGSGGDWVGFVGTSREYVALNFDALKLVMELGGLTSLPQIPARGSERLALPVGLKAAGAELRQPKAEPNQNVPNALVALAADNWAAISGGGLGLLSVALMLSLVRRRGAVPAPRDAAPQIDTMRIAARDVTPRAPVVPPVATASASVATVASTEEALAAASAAPAMRDGRDLTTTLAEVKASTETPSVVKALVPESSTETSLDQGSEIADADRAHNFDREDALADATLHTANISTHASDEAASAEWDDFDVLIEAHLPPASPVEFEPVVVIEDADVSVVENDEGEQHQLAGPLPVLALPPPARFDLVAAPAAETPELAAAPSAEVQPQVQALSRVSRAMRAVTEVAQPLDSPRQPRIGANTGGANSVLRGHGNGQARAFSKRGT